MWLKAWLVADGALSRLSLIFDARLSYQQHQQTQRPELQYLTHCDGPILEQAASSG